MSKDVQGRFTLRWRSAPVGQFFLPKAWLVEGRGVVLEKMKRQENSLFKVGVLRRSSFLSKALRLPKKLDLRKTPPSKSVATLATMSFFYLCTKFSTKGLLPYCKPTLDKSVTLGQSILNSPRIHDHNLECIYGTWYSGS